MYSKDDNNWPTLDWECRHYQQEQSLGWRLQAPNLLPKKINNLLIKVHVIPKTVILYLSALFDRRHKKLWLTGNGVFLSSFLFRNAFFMMYLHLHRKYVNLQKTISIFISNLWLKIVISFKNLDIARKYKLFFERKFLSKFIDFYLYIIQTTII